ncbi:MAG: hypothetical protein ACK4K9_00055 [Bacteroidia bacterium]
MYKFKILNIIAIFILLITAISCSNTDIKKSTEIKTVELMRFEQELFKCKTNNDFLNLRKKYPEFYQSFCTDILNIKPEFADNNFIEALQSFLNHEGIKMLKKDVDSVFKDVSDIEMELSLAQQNFEANFTGYRFPRFLTFLSEFTYANVSYDTLIGIGLDMYLGSDYPYYKTLQIDFPEFLVRKLRREYIAANAIKALGIGLFEHQLKEKRFLAFILFEGKIRYFVKQLLPSVHDSIVFGITGQQLKWCKENEPQMWAHYIERKLLFNTEVEKFMRYINDGPFTIADGVPQESAPGIGVYTGYRIIEEYVKKQKPKLQDLMENNNWEEILKKSGYSPDNT